MHPIDPTKSTSEVARSEADLTKEISSKLATAVSEKQRLAIGLLLKQTLQHMSESGLLSVDTQKAALSAKNILPGEYTQLYIQDRIQQHRLQETLNNQPVKPMPLTTDTIRQWFSGQIIQTIVYQATQNGQASLLVNEKGYFSTGNFPLTDTQKSALKTLIPDGQVTTKTKDFLANSTVSSNQFINNLLDNKQIKDSQLVKIKTELPLQIGQQLLLQVNKNKGDISLQLNHPPRESHIISQLINQLATKQQAMPQLLASLREISVNVNQASSTFTEKFIQQVNKVIDQFPTLPQLSTAKEVKSTILNSGQFLENKIITTAVNKDIPSVDFKAALSQLVSLIKNNEAIVLPKTLPSHDVLYQSIAQQNKTFSIPTSPLFFQPPARVFHAQVQPPVIDSTLFQLNNHLLLQNRLLDQLEGVLSRIMLTQIQTREGGEQAFLNFEIPFRHNEQQEILQLKIREEIKDIEAKKGNKVWTVNLAFHLPSLGGIRIYITMDKHDLAIQFWTEEVNAQKLFQKYFYLLNDRLTAAGYTLSQLKAFHGMPEQAQEEIKNSHFIVDEKV